MIRNRPRSKSPEVPDSPSSDSNNKFDKYSRDSKISTSRSLKQNAGKIIGGVAVLSLIVIAILRFRNAPPTRTPLSLLPAIESAVALSIKAGEEIVKLRDGVTEIVGSAEPVTVADETSHNILTQMSVGKTLIVSEEGIANGAVQRADDRDVVVFVDPLDATQEYTEKLTGYVSIQICFTRCGKTISSILYFPFTHMMYIALPSGELIQSVQPRQLLLGLRTKDAEDFLPPPLESCDCDEQRAKKRNFQPVDVDGPGVVRRRPTVSGTALRLIVTRSHFRNESRSSSGTLSMRTAIEILQQIYPNMQLIRAGGAGFKLEAVLNNDADAYIHDGPIRMWDVCAGARVLQADGGTVTDWMGEPHNLCLPTDTTDHKAGFAVRGIIATRDVSLHKQLLDVIMGKFGNPE